MRLLPDLVLCAMLVFIGLGVFNPKLGFPWYSLAAFALLPLMVVLTSVPRLKAPWERTVREDARFSISLLAAAYAMVSATGGGESPLYPLVFLVMAGVARFHVPPVALIGLAGSILVELLGYFVTRQMSRGGAELAAHLAFLGAFAATNTVLRKLGAMVAARRDAREASRQAAAASKRARDYNLLAKSGTTGKVDLDRFGEKADQAIAPMRSHLLDILRIAADARTSALYWFDEKEQRFRLHDFTSRPGSPRPLAVVPPAGVLGSLLKMESTLAIQDFRSAHGGVPYYDSSVKVSAFMGSPIKRKGRTVGVLCIDKDEHVPFDEDLRPLLSQAASFFLRLVDDERYLIELINEREEVHRFYEAAKNLNKALTTSDVHERTAEALESVADTELLAFTTLEESMSRNGALTIKHRVSFVKGPAAAKYLEGLEFEDTGAVSLVCRRGVTFNKNISDMRKRGAPMGILGERELRGVESVLILPLVAQDRTAGSLILGSTAKDAYPDDVVERVRIIANQAAVCMLNAELYAKMEKMAVTDGLTGLYNHRYFQERLSDYIARAERHSQVFSILLTDIDHFKRVNDTHGHPVGDKVLKGFSELLARSVRKIDLVARYGGEEFIIVLDGTNRIGAVQLADRIRDDASKMLFAGVDGPFSVTVSIGISVFPEDATEKAELVDKADQALYYSKEHGRNRTTTWVQVKGAASSD